MKQIDISMETANALAGAVEGLAAEEVFAALNEELEEPVNLAELASVLYDEDGLDLDASDVAKSLKAIPGIDNTDIAAALYSSKGADLDGPTIANALKDGCGLGAVEVANALYSEDGCDLDAVEVADALYSSMYDEKKINGAGQHHQAVSDTLDALCSGDGLGMDIEDAVKALHGAGVAKADIRDAMRSEVEGGMEYSAAEVQKIMGAAFPSRPRPRDNGLEL